MVDLAAHLSIECLKVPIGSVAGTCVKTTSPCRLVGGYPKCRCIFNLLWLRQRPWVLDLFRGPFSSVRFTRTHMCVYTYIYSHTHIIYCRLLYRYRHVHTDICSIHYALYSININLFLFCEAFRSNKKNFRGKTPRCHFDSKPEALLCGAFLFKAGTCAKPKRLFFSSLSL